MPRAVVIHAGFHKTGTTSVQNMLRANRAALRPGLRIVLRPAMVALCEAARAYSVSQSQVDLGLVRFEAAELSQSWGDGPETVLMCSEDLSGHMPGRRGLRTYAAAPALMRAMTDSITAAQPDVAVTVVFTTRAPEAWLASCFSQHVRATRMTQTAAQYARSYRASADLSAIADDVRTALPAHTVDQIALEDCAQSPLGPLDPLLRIAGVPEGSREALTALPPANTALPPDDLAALLAINRSDGTDAEVKAAKRAWRGRMS